MIKYSQTIDFYFKIWFLNLMSIYIYYASLFSDSQKMFYSYVLDHTAHTK